jgi:alcohol dehydrogenase (NADP+)
LQENFLAADLELEATDLTAIAAMDQGYRFVDGAFFQSPGSPYSVADLWGNRST